jgi:hypothetical protein
MTAQTLSLTLTTDSDGKVFVNGVETGFSFYEKTPFYWVESTGKNFVMEDAPFTLPENRTKFVMDGVKHLIKKGRIKL